MIVIDRSEETAAPTTEADPPEARSDPPPTVEPDEEVALPPPPVEPPTWSAGRPYSDDSPWNTPIASDAPVHQRSAAYVERIGDTLTSDTSQYTLPVYEVDGSTATTPVHVRNVFSNVVDDGTSLERSQDIVLDVPVPDDAAAAAGTDAQIVIVNTDTGEEWGFWHFGADGDGYRATNGYRYHVGWNAVPPDGFGSRGAGVPYLTGLIRPEELEAGRIGHAIAFAYPTPSGEYVYPATKSDGPGDPDVDLPEGARLRLDPSLGEDDFDRMGLGHEGRVIARALQEFGMILIDIAGRPKIYAEYEETAGWDGAITEDTISALPMERFEVIDWEAAEADPVAQPTAPDHAPIGADIVLDGTASYAPDGQLDGYEWTDAADHVIGDDPSIRYPSDDLASGTHRFTLRVADDLGAWSAPRHVYVDVEVPSGPFVAMTYEATATDVSQMRIQTGRSRNDDTLLVAVALRRVNAEDDVAVDRLDVGEVPAERILREVDERGTIALEIWAIDTDEPRSGSDEIRVELSSRTNVAVQAVSVSGIGPLTDRQSIHSDGRATEAEMQISGSADGLVVGFHVGRTQDVHLDVEGGEINVANTTVDDDGGSLRLSSFMVRPERDRSVELRGSTRSPMDRLMVGLSFDAPLEP